MTMDGQIPNLENLFEILRRELALHKELLALVKSEKEALVAVNIKGIRDATFNKESLLSDVQREEASRRRWVADLANHTGLSEAELTAEKVAEIYGSQYFESLVSLRNALRFILLQLKEVNSENQRLTENALRESQLMKENALGMTGDRAATYGPRGNMGMAKEKNSRILSREA